MIRRTFAIATLLATSPATAGGLIVPGLGSQAQPRAGAFVAKADDPTAIYYNPAGFARQHGTALHLGVNFLDFDQRFQRTGVYEPPLTGDPESYAGDPYPTVENDKQPTIGIGRAQGVPTLALTTDFGGRSPLVFGFGIFGENGYPSRDYGRFGSGYAFEDPSVPPPPQRYDIVESDVWAAFPSVAVAYAFDKLAVGARVSWGYASIRGRTSVWGVRNYEEDIHLDGDVTLNVKDKFVPVAQLGVLYQLTPAIELGAQYTTQRNINAHGTGKAPFGSGLGVNGERDFITPVVGDDVLCADGGTRDALKVCTEFILPQIATVGGRYVLRDADGRERGDLELDVQWEDWSKAADTWATFDGKSNLTGVLLKRSANRHGYRDTYSFRLGGSYEIPSALRWTVRGGVAHDTGAAPVSFTRLEQDGQPRTTFGAGLGFTVGRTRFDAGAGYVYEPRREVSNSCQPTYENKGCDGSGMETPPEDRTAPDPVQPAFDPNRQVQSPYNAGVYEQHYLLFSLGATYAF